MSPPNKMHWNLETVLNECRSIAQYKGKNPMKALNHVKETE